MACASRDMKAIHSPAPSNYVGSAGFIAGRKAAGLEHSTPREIEKARSAGFFQTKCGKKRSRFTPLNATSLADLNRRAARSACGVLRHSLQSVRSC